MCLRINDMKLISDFFFQDLINRLAGTVMTGLTYEPRPGDSFIQSYLRYQLAPVMCNTNNSTCILTATRQFDDLKINDTEYA